MTVKNFAKSIARRAKNRAFESMLEKDGPGFYAKKAIEALNRPEITAPKVPEFPNQVVIENSSICNLNCVMCLPKKSTREKSMIDEGLLDHVLSQFKDLGLTYTEFHTINEPLLHPKLDRLLTICRKYNIKVGISTNGLLIKERLEILNEFSDIIGISVSIDGATRETYNKIRQGGEFNDLIDNLNALEEAQIIKEGKFPRVQVALSNLNIFEAGLFFETFKMIKPYNIRFTLLNCLAADNSVFKEQKFALYDKYKAKEACPLPFVSMFVLNNGKVTVCCRDFHESLIVGNINDNTLLEIWNGQKIKEIRNAHRSGKLDGHPVCAECEMSDRGLSEFVNAYLHFLYYKGFNSNQINDQIEACLKIMDLNNKKNLEELLK